MDERKTYIHITTTAEIPTIDCIGSGTTSDLIDCFAVEMANEIKNDNLIILA